MNAYLEPVFPVLMTAIASPDKTFGLWLQKGTLVYSIGLPLAGCVAAVGVGLLSREAWKVATRKGARRNRTLQSYMEALGGQRKGLAAVAFGAALTGALHLTGQAPVRLDAAQVMPVWHKPTPSQVLQAMTSCEYWVSPVAPSDRYTCPVAYGHDWKGFMVKATSTTDSAFAERQEPKAADVVRNISSEQMQVLVNTAHALASQFSARGCYMPAHPAAQVWCPGNEASKPLAEWAIQTNPTGWGHRSCGFGKPYVYTAKQYLDPSIESSLTAPALVRYVMPSAVSCGGDGVSVAMLGAWLSEGVSGGNASESPVATPVKDTSEAVALAKY